MRRSVKLLAWTLGILLAVPVLLLGAVLLAANTQPGRDFIERMLPTITGDMVRLEGLGGPFPAGLRAARVEIRDAEGAWLIIEQLTLNWTPSRLLIGEALVDHLAAGRIGLERLPASDPEPSESSESSAFSLPVRVELQSLDVARLDLAPPVVGTRESFSIQGHARLDSLWDGDIGLDIQGLGYAGDYHLEGRFDSARLTGRLKAEEPPNGPVARLAGLEEVGAIVLNASLKGPHTAVATQISLNAGPLSAKVKGELDLPDQAADLKITASAPAMSPLPDVSWESVALDANLEGPFTRPTAAGKLRIAYLRAAGTQIGSIAADIQGDTGDVQLQASLEDLRIPGQRPEVLAAAPLSIKAEVRLDKPERPLTFSLEHPLIRARGKARTGGEIQAKVSLSLPDLAPLAAAGGAEVEGHSDLEIHVKEKAGAMTLDAKGGVAITGGMPPLVGLLGDSAQILASAVLRGPDVTLSRLQLEGKSIQLSADGGLVSQVADLGWRLSLSDLAAITPSISGNLQAQGRLEGQTDDLSAAADLSGELATKGFPSAPLSAHLEVKGLPDAPTGEVSAQGTIAGSPLELALVAQRSSDGETRLDIERADWKSAHGEGQVSFAPGSLFPVGRLDLGMTRLQDLESLIDPSPTGALSAKFQATTEGSKTRARLELDARAVGLPGVGGVDKLFLAARVLDPLTSPDLDAKLVFEGFSAQGLSGAGRLEVKGPQDALALQVAVDGKGPSGSPLRLSGGALLNATGKEVAIDKLQASWKGETLRLLSPARIAFAEGISLEGLKLGIREAVLNASGRLSPALDFTAEVRNLSPSLASVFVPDLKVEGKVGAEASLAGTLAQPTGKVRVEAIGVRMRNGPAASLPAADLKATATLTGESAQVEARLNLGTEVKLALTGRAPLSSTGRMDLRAQGSADLSLADPILAAGGRSARGQLQLNAGLSGSAANPRLSGTIGLTRGEIQDYSLGVHLNDIEALLQLEGERARISRLRASAGPGTVSASGTVGIMEPNMPIDLRLEAQDARLLSSDLLTVTLDASLTASGQLTKRLLISGNIHNDKAEIRIPETLSTSVATLDVRRPGEKPPAPSAPGPKIDLDLSIEAPGEIFVRGRGLDAELGGNVRVQGTATDPKPIGSFEMRRGQFSLAGQTLNFSKGKVSFNGGSLADPSLDFVISRSTQDGSAALNVGGTASNPKITLSSTPELPQDEILAQILFGRSATTLSGLELAEIASSLAQLTGVTSHLFNPLGGIREGLGLDELRVGTDSSGQATLEAGRYVAPGVYVGVEQGASADGTKAKVQVELTKRLKLEGTVGSGSSSSASSSEEGSSSIGITYEFEY